MKINLRDVLYPRKSELTLTPDDMICYSYKPDTMEYVGVAHGDESPREPGEILWPAYTVLVRPPDDLPSGHVWVWADTNWIPVRDYRGTHWLDPNTWDEHVIDSLGPVDPTWVTGQTAVDMIHARIAEKNAEEAAAADRKREEEENQEAATRDPRDFWVAKHELLIILSREGFADDFVTNKLAGNELRFVWQSMPGLNYMDDPSKEVLDALGFDDHTTLSLMNKARQLRGQ